MRAFWSCLYWPTYVHMYTTVWAPFSVIFSHWRATRWQKKRRRFGETFLYLFLLLRSIFICMNTSSVQESIHFYLHVSTRYFQKKKKNKSQKHCESLRFIVFLFYFFKKIEIITHFSVIYYPMSYHIIHRQKYDTTWCISASIGTWPGLYDDDLFSYPPTISNLTTGLEFLSYLHLCVCYKNHLSIIFPPPQHR